LENIPVLFMYLFLLIRKKFLVRRRKNSLKVEKIENKLQIVIVLKLLDPDPGEPIIYVSNFIRIRISNTGF